MNTLKTLPLLSLLIFILSGCGEKERKVYFIAPHDGAQLHSPIKVKMGIKGLKVEPAGELKPNSGHHHIIVNGKPVPPGQLVMSDKQHIHFGKAQTEAELDLPPGEHKLTLQFANGAHLSFGAEYSHSIKIKVLKKGEKAAHH